MQTFSPFRCLPKSLFLLYLIAFAAMFWWGRYLSLVKVTVQAFVGDKKVDADIVLPNGEKVKTPGPVRGRNGQKYSVQYKDYEPRTLTFTRGKNSEKVTFRAEGVSLYLAAYDTEANEIEKTKVSVPARGIKDRLTRCLLSGTVNEKPEKIYVEPGSGYKGPREREILWHDENSYKKWLDDEENGLLKILDQISDGQYNQKAWEKKRQDLKLNASPTQHIFPLIFKAAKKTASVASQKPTGQRPPVQKPPVQMPPVQKPPVQKPPFTPPGGNDTPIPYEITSTKKRSPT